MLGAQGANARISTKRGNHRSTNGTWACGTCFPIGRAETGQEIDSQTCLEPRYWAPTRSASGRVVGANTGKIGQLAKSAQQHLRQFLSMYFCTILGGTLTASDDEATKGATLDEDCRGSWLSVGDGEVAFASRAWSQQFMVSTRDDAAAQPKQTALKLRTRGFQVSEIAKALDVSERTVFRYLSSN